MCTQRHLSRHRRRRELRQRVRQQDPTFGEHAGIVQSLTRAQRSHVYAHSTDGAQAFATVAQACSACGRCYVPSKSFRRRHAARALRRVEQQQQHSPRHTSTPTTSNSRATAGGAAVTAKTLKAYFGIEDLGSLCDLCFRAFEQQRLCLQQQQRSKKRINGTPPSVATSKPAAPNPTAVAGEYPLVQGSDTSIEAGLRHLHTSIARMPTLTRWAASVSVAPAPINTALRERFVHLAKTMLRGPATPTFARGKRQGKRAASMMSVYAGTLHGRLPATALSPEQQSSLTGNGIPRLRLTFHGTPLQNHDSIFQRGLCVPSVASGVRVANGSAYGIGVYSSTEFGTAQHYARGCGRILACALIDTTQHDTWTVGRAKGPVCKAGSIYVAKSASFILPLWTVDC